MVHCEFDFSKAFQKQLDDELFAKTLVKFADKFKLCMCCVGTAEGQYKLLKDDFERFYKDFNFDEEWKKVAEE